MSTPSRALITGSSSGIGAAFARRLAAEGYSLVIHGRRRTLLEELSLELSALGSPGVQIVTGDLLEETTILELVAAALNPGIDLLINNAGYGAGDDFFGPDGVDQLNMIEVHCRVPVRLCRELIPSMRERGFGQVINVSSLAGEQILPGSGLYLASKAFLTRFSESLALGLRGSGVQIQALLPGFTYSDFHAKLEHWNHERRSRGIIRWQSADEVADFSLINLRKNPGRIRVIPGFFNRILAALPSILPRRLYYRIVLMVRQ